jgi:hypothetical protein
MNKLFGLAIALSFCFISIEASAIDPVATNGIYQIKTDGNGKFFVQRHGYTTATADSLEDAKKTAEDQAEVMGDDMSGGWSDEGGGDDGGGDDGGGDDGGDDQKCRVGNEKACINVYLTEKLKELSDRIDALEGNQ